MEARGLDTREDGDGDIGTNHSARGERENNVRICPVVDVQADGRDLTHMPRVARSRCRLERTDVHFSFYSAMMVA